MDTIIFSRIWDSGLIKVSLDCAKKHCPNCRIIHFHNETSGVGWEDSVDLSKEFNEAITYTESIPESCYSQFRKMQEVCLARWKVLSDWMESEGIDEVFHCDSDVLLFNDPFESPHYSHGRLLLSDNRSGLCHAGNAMIPRTCAKEFWPFMQKLIRDGVYSKGHLTDMSVWTLLGRILGFFNQNQIIDGMIFDHHLGSLEDGTWEDDGKGYKKLTWKDGQPYCKHLPSCENIRLLNLHCWGQAESRMAEYAQH